MMMLENLLREVKKHQKSFVSKDVNAEIVDAKTNIVFVLLLVTNAL